jgi:hypothetical protein
MKKLLLLLLPLLSMGALFSCKEGVDNEGKTRIIQDSLNSVLPTWQALKIKVEDDHSTMNIVVGDATFYNASDDEKKKKAIELGQMVERIYGKGNYLEKGNLIVTKDVRNTSERPADGITIPIDFKVLNKEMYK